MDIPSLQHIDYMAFRIRSGRPERLVVFMEGRLRHYDAASGRVVHDTVFEYDDVFTCSRDGSLFVVDTPEGLRIIDAFGTTVQDLRVTSTFLKHAYFEPDSTYLYFVYRRPSSPVSTVEMFRRGRQRVYQKAAAIEDLKDFLWMSFPRNTLVTRSKNGRIAVRKFQNDRDRSPTGALIPVDNTFLLSADTGQTIWHTDESRSCFSIPLRFGDIPEGVETWQVFLRNTIPVMLGDFPVCVQDILRAGRPDLLIYDAPACATAAGSFIAVANNHRGKLTVFDVAHSVVPSWIDRRRVMNIDVETLHANPWGRGIYCVVEDNKLSHISADGRALVDVEIRNGTIIDFAFLESSDGARFLLMAVEPRKASEQPPRTVVPAMRPTTLLLYRFTEPHRMDTPVRHDVPVSVHALSAAGPRVAMVLKGRLRGRHLGVLSLQPAPMFNALDSDTMKARLRENSHVQIRVDTTGTLYILTGDRRSLGHMKTGEAYEQQSALYFKNEYSYYRVSIDGTWEVFGKRNPNIVLIVRRRKVVRKLSPWGCGNEYLTAANGEISDVRLTASSKYTLVALGHRKNPAILAHEMVTGHITQIPLERSWSNTEFLKIEPLHSPGDDLFALGRIPLTTTALKIYSISRRACVNEYSFPADIPPGHTYHFETEEQNEQSETLHGNSHA